MNCYVLFTLENHMKRDETKHILLLFKNQLSIHYRYEWYVLSLCVYVWLCVFMYKISSKDFWD